MSQQRFLSITTMLAAIISIGAVSVSLHSIQAQEGELFSASLSGEHEVPPTESNATGWAKFQTDDNGTHLSYWVNITGLNEITGTHIHNGSASQNGDILVNLSGLESAKNGDKDNATISLKGNITKDNLEGPLKGKELSELVGLMSDGNLYVNVHTDEFQKGAIRGQIVSGLPQIDSNMGSNNTSSNEG